MKTVIAKESTYDISPEHLKTGSIFGALSNISIQYLLDQGVLHKVNKGDEIFSYGSKGNSFHAVLHGKLDFYKQHGEKKIRTRTISFGEAIGFVSMIALHERVGSLSALEDSLLLEISCQLFSDFHDQYPFDFGILLMNLSRDMARTIRVLSNALVENDVTIKRN
ncbi:cyclic nucleotide-binding domain-containing protein [Marinomonas sp. M1K-6]|uniref:Cyclic nucleotide-binding domain-containing protein n=1 Tax=Marinomonas profundi TaxID=2726122 RepID=A0A847R631_9GAMM|nr:cyclic nucleotide-binding domain-containing protein [Marinomonas profundi]NLQ16344.1 cyclic nucleotide-binding domain-containing protein [Marinomonas profundi]UDV03081.1 cyclic nucleotide-binding domain-containing protein [Marinomonas profundi]